MKIKTKKPKAKFILELSEEEFLNVRYAMYVFSSLNRYNNFVPSAGDNKAFHKLYLEMNRTYTPGRPL